MSVTIIGSLADAVLVCAKASAGMVARNRVRNLSIVAINP